VQSAAPASPAPERRCTQDYLNAYKLKSINNTRPHLAAHPDGQEEWKEGENDQPGEMVVTGEWETVNQVARCGHAPRKTSRRTSNDEFYKQISYDSEDPGHAQPRGRLDRIQSVHSQQGADGYVQPHKAAGVKRYVKRSFIMDDAQARWSATCVSSAGSIPALLLKCRANCRRKVAPSRPSVKAATKRVLGMLKTQ
jgi:molecular chaperone HtpG